MFYFITVFNVISDIFYGSINFVVSFDEIATYLGDSRDRFEIKNLKISKRKQLKISIFLICRRVMQRLNLVKILNNIFFKNAEQLLVSSTRLPCVYAYTGYKFNFQSTIKKILFPRKKK